MARDEDTKRALVATLGGPHERRVVPCTVHECQKRRLIPTVNPCSAAPSLAPICSAI